MKLQPAQSGTAAAGRDDWLPISSQYAEIPRKIPSPMKPMPYLIAALLSLGAATQLAAWGIEGHKAVGEVARTRLSATARAAVVKILGNDDLAAVAVWADEIRDAGRHRGPLVSDAEAKAFTQKFPKNPSWHFVDQPLGTTGYTDNGKFSSEEDVVHTINSCIAVLEGKSSRFTASRARLSLEWGTHVTVAVFSITVSGGLLQQHLRGHLSIG